MLPKSQFRSRSGMMAFIRKVVVESARNAHPQERRRRISDVHRVPDLHGFQTRSGAIVIHGDVQRAICAIGTRHDHGGGGTHGKCGETGERR